MKHNIEEMRKSTVWNAPCIICDVVKEGYIRLGALPFCIPCYHHAIELATPAQASEVYSKYLKKYLGEEK